MVEGLKQNFVSAKNLLKPAKLKAIVTILIAAATLPDNAENRLKIRIIKQLRLGKELMTSAKLHVLVLKIN